ncbi:helix-turn-helix transcriptional regulator [Nocardia sp. CA-135953]|uniref:helix-turn-helix transcriptional regulator n=1 Tax=Nocardia sp. CA-135953 TaxID=3239978 RepID=UPI003D954C82
MSVTRHSHATEAPEPNDFVGRGAELDKIVTMLLRPTRLVTLIGPGGIGKTRLASEAVGRYHRARHIPVRWVRLARLAKGSDVTAIEDAVAESVVGTDFSGRSAWNALVDAVTEVDAVGRPVQSVLVVDNCEHVLDAVSIVIARLLEATPGLSVLATSREPIRWVDEQLVMVPPLSPSQAVTFFGQRAELAGRPLVGDDQITTAAAICRHLHNHPLYIRLAAARLVDQPLATILQELSGAEDDQRMRWSDGLRVGAEPRHRGVEDVIAWSYDLCADKERLLFDRLSVFAAGYDSGPGDDGGDAANDQGVDLEAIEVVCCDEADVEAEPGSMRLGLARDEIEDLLEHLIERSLVSVRITPTATRYFLLETLRVFAAQRLRERTDVESDEPERLAARHRRYYRDKVSAAAAQCFGPAEYDYLNWTVAAWDNILIAIEGSTAAPGQSVHGLEICIGLFALRMPWLKGSFREIRLWTDRTLAATRALDPQPAELQTHALAVLVWVALNQGKPEDAERMLDECVRLCLPDPDSRANWRRSVETDIGLPAHVELAWGMELILAHDDSAATATFLRARDKFEHLGETRAAVTAETFAAISAAVSGATTLARELAEHALEVATAAEAPQATSWAQMALAITLTKSGNPAAALDVGRAALTYQYRSGDQWSALWMVQARMWSLARLITDSVGAGNADRDESVVLATEISRLAGGAATLRGRLGLELEGFRLFAAENDQAVAISRQVLGTSAYAAAQSQGSRLRPESAEVQRLALGTLSMDEHVAAGLHDAGDTESAWGTLTVAEQEVATLAAAQWTNSAIAARRGNSVRTVDAQITAILRKLMISSRHDIIRFVSADSVDDAAAASQHRVWTATYMEK